MRRILLATCCCLLALSATAYGDSGRSWDCGQVQIGVGAAPDWEDPNPTYSIHLSEVPLNIAKELRLEWRRGRMYLNGKQCKYLYPITHGADPKDLDKFGYPKQ